MDLFNFLADNDVKQFAIKDIQLMMNTYDIDKNGFLNYNEFLKFVLPRDIPELRADVC